MVSKARSKQQETHERRRRFISSKPKPKKTDLVEKRLSLNITLALSVYDRHIPFFDGTVTVKDGDLKVLAVGEANALRDGGKRHHRMLIDREFDACEVSLSSYIMARSQGLPFTAIPVFPRRLFSQSHVWSRTTIHPSARLKI